MKTRRATPTSAKRRLSSSRPPTLLLRSILTRLDSPRCCCRPGCSRARGTSSRWRCSRPPSCRRGTRSLRSRRRHRWRRAARLGARTDPTPSRRSARHMAFGRRRQGERGDDIFFIIGVSASVGKDDKERSTTGRKKGPASPLNNDGFSCPSDRNILDVKRNGLPPPALGRDRQPA